MGAQRSHRLPFTSTWMLVFFLPPVCVGIDKPILQLENKVYMTLSGEVLNVTGTLMKPANETAANLECFNSSNTKIYHIWIQGTTVPVTERLQLKLKNLTGSGKYYCKYKTAQAYWFLRVRASGYRNLEKVDTEFIPVGIFTGLLLVFSVLGSVYVFRGHWKEKMMTERGDADRKQKSREKDTEAEEGKMEMSAAQSTSFYASLEPRPRSIYDVLNPSAAKAEPDQKKDASRTKKSTETVPQNAGQRDEGIFESVYENF